MSRVTVHRFKKFDIVQGVEIETAYGKWCNARWLLHPTKTVSSGRSP